MRIGLDLDNTIICYDESFHRVALEMGLLADPVGATKSEVKSAVQDRHGNDVWTELQGEVYGARLNAAKPYPGALEFVHQCRAAGHDVSIISHKTRFPAIGRQVDLREAALGWLAERGWFDERGITAQDVEFHGTRAEKVAAIARLECDIFIDDLPEVFREPGFPAGTTRILFDPEKVFGNWTRTLRAGSWQAVSQMVFSYTAEVSTTGDSQARVGDLSRELLRMAHLPEPRAIQPMQGGRNNKVFRVSTSAGDVLFKSYFHSPKDTRDRLGQEIAFLEHLARTGCRYSARPLASRPAENVAIMEFIEGVRPQLEEVDEKHIDQATDFFFEANRNLDHPLTRALPSASEACFTIDEHLACTQRRVDRLAHMLNEDEVDAEAVEFVRTELAPAWSEVRAAIEAAWPTDQARHAPLPQSERCLSPSDFGFHNSLRQEDGRLFFLDFEYAGWDDPAKLIIDFANQPDMLLDRALSNRFRTAAIAASASPEALERRVTALEPLYQIKWSCICLNDFLEFGRTRHQFTDGPQADQKARRKFQLERARLMLRRAGTPVAS